MNRGLTWGLVSSASHANRERGFHQFDVRGLLVQGASHVSIGLSDTMVPYGDYFYPAALDENRDYSSVSTVCKPPGALSPGNKLQVRRDTCLDDIVP